MVRIPFDRRLCTRSLRMGPVALAALLVIGTPRLAAGVVRRDVLIRAAPADTDFAADTMNPLRRASRRGGYLITDDQLAQEQDYPLSSVLIAHIPGIRVIHTNTFDRVASGMHLELNGAPCFVQMFMDGVYIPEGDVDIVSVRDLAAIEFRTPGSVPVEFQNRLPGAACGVLLLWSKS